MLTRLKLLRLQAGVKQYELAAKIGVAPPQMSRWENGLERPTAQRLRELAEALNVPMRELADNEIA